MGASSWPALSETTNNKSSSDSLKSLTGVVDAAPSPPLPVSQGIANASVPSAPKQPGRANPNPTLNHSRQRSFKRNGASGSAANGAAPQPSAQGSLAESHNPSPRGQNQRNGFPSQTHGGGAGGGGTDNVSQRDSYRNQNGNHHQSHGGRRNQEHGNQNWTFSRSFNGRDGNAQSQRGAPAFVRHPPPPVQTIPPQFMAAQPFASPLPFPPELASQYYQRMPFVAPLSPAPVFYHVQDPPLNIKLQKQIHYYFSEENLIKDMYLRRQMDDQGFVPLPVIAVFNKVAELTDSVQQIADALQGSPVVEVQGDRIRKRFNWQHWLIPQEPNPAVSNPQSVGAVASRVGNLALGESSAGPNGGSSSQLQPAGAENEAVSDGQQQSPGGVPVSNRNDSDGANR
ncbi:La-related protein 1C [Raphanus sativus]|nr:La-related protein 1C [Raphanus sativus]